jgi:hypothetical protein
MTRKKQKPCPFDGCGRLTWSSSTYCTEHVTLAKTCVYDDCVSRVAFWNRSRLCKEHNWLASK